MLMPSIYLFITYRAIILNYAWYARHSIVGSGYVANIFMYYLFPLLNVVSVFYLSFCNYPDGIMYTKTLLAGIFATIFCLAFFTAIFIQIYFTTTIINHFRTVRMGFRKLTYLFATLYFYAGLNFAGLILLQKDGLEYTGKFSVFDAVYFSFVTLATTGYGDMKPISTYTKSIVILENFIGIYITAYIVSMIITTRRRIQK